VADDNIIETCRREAQAWINAGIGDGWPLTQAAAAIEAQQAEIERLRAVLDVVDAQVAAYMNGSIGSSRAIQTISRLLDPEEARCG
jgi:hypothetical protein